MWWIGGGPNALTSRCRVNWSPAASRSAYFARQIPRLLWYVGHAYVMSRLAENARKQTGNSKRPPNRTSAPVPDRQRLYRDLAALFRTDLANVEAGLYPLPRDRDGSLLTLLDRSGLFFQDLPRVHHRRQAGDHTEVVNEQTRGRRPNYYLQNFHFQTGGWMTEDSAKRYDLQVEVLFYGTANAIRRQALPPLREAFAGRDQRWLRRGPSAKGTARVCALLQRGQESSRAPEGCAGAPRHSTGGHDQLTSNAGRTSPSVCPNLSFWYRQVAKVEEVLASVGLTSKMAFFPARTQRRRATAGRDRAGHRSGAFGYSRRRADRRSGCNKWPRNDDNSIRMAQARRPRRPRGNSRSAAVWICKQDYAHRGRLAHA